MFHKLKFPAAFILIFLFLSCKNDINKQIRKLEIGEEISVAEMTGKKNCRLYLLDGNLNDDKFLEYCDDFKTIGAYESWELALILVDKNNYGTIYFLERYYDALGADYFDNKTEEGKVYNPNNVMIKKYDYNKYSILLH